MISYSSKDKKILSEGFSGVFWKTLITPYAKVMEQLNEKILKGDMSHEQRDSLRREYSFYERLVNLPRGIHQVESSQPSTDHDPYPDS